MHAITWMLIMAFTVSINAVGLLANEETKQEVVFEDTQSEKVDAKQEEKKVVVETKKVEEKKEVAPAAVAVAK